LRCAELLGWLLWPGGRDRHVIFWLNKASGRSPGKTTLYARLSNGRRILNPIVEIGINVNVPVNLAELSTPCLPFGNVVGMFTAWRW
jgi:hypothetical protein